VWLLSCGPGASGKAIAGGVCQPGRPGAFGQGHVLAFQVLGGVPGGIGDDNLRDRVDRILPGRDRVENQRFIALGRHYGFDSFLLPAREAWRA
jgi:hypothetical protein